MSGSPVDVVDMACREGIGLTPAAGQVREPQQAQARARARAQEVRQAQGRVPAG